MGKSRWDDAVIGWRVVRPDFTSSHGFRWPFPGKTAKASGPFTYGSSCPSAPGDGLCIAKTWKGAASGGIPAVTALLVAYLPEDVLGEDVDKVRVKRAKVLDVFDPQALLRAGFGSGANLYRADLRGADLFGADLFGADLFEADLRGANHDSYTRWPEGFDVSRCAS